jgi:aquaporin Z
VTTTLVSTPGARAPRDALTPLVGPRIHVAEYLLEAAQLGIFMLSACVCTLLIEHPASPLRQSIPAAAPRRALSGLCMALTAAGLIYSGWGQRSGAHLNPAVTLTFLRLRRIAPLDAAAYVLAQVGGALLGVACARALLGEALAHPSVSFAVTVPGLWGWRAAFLGELAISFGLMLVVLLVSNHPRHHRKAGAAAAALVATYITVEAPLSGMSMNPARTLGSALLAWRFDCLWLYLVAPPLGMLLAAELYVRLQRVVHCAKLGPHGSAHCIFRCRYAELVARGKSHPRHARRGTHR